MSFLTTASVAVPAVPPCAPREVFEARLAGTWRERLSGHGVTGAGGLLELWTSEGGATWTLIVTDPRKRACLVAEGRNWRRSPAGRGI